MFNFECSNCKIPFKQIIYYCEKYNIDVQDLNLFQTCKLIKQYEIDKKIKNGLFFAEPPELEERLKKIKKVIDI